MKKHYLLIAALVVCLSASGQETHSKKQSFPITISIFSESIGLPNFKNLFRGKNLGIRVGTELYYRQSSSRQVFQTINVGFYNHPNFHNGLYINTEVGYRKLSGKAFADGTFGVGYLVVKSALPRYEFQGDKFIKARTTFGRVMPTLGLGAGYQLNSMSVFSKYEMFGEVPFGLKGLPALPHKALHLGTRFNLISK